MLGIESPREQPTAHDLEIARIRDAIARRQQEEYDRCLAWAEKAFGPGWLPRGRHFLLEKDDEDRSRATGEKARPAAVVYTVRNDAGESRHFSVSAEQITEHTRFEDGFGSMLLEPHPTRGFQHQGKWCAIHRYSLCFAPYELYRPKSAQELAALRASRERLRAERERKRWEDEHPLFAGLEDG
jgi:hypothetical protein